MKIQQLIDRIQTLYSHGVQTDDSRLEERYIYNILNTKRILAITRKLNAKQRLSSSFYTTIPFFYIKEYKDDCINCSIYRSVKKVPKTISSLYSKGILQIRSVDDSVNFNFVDKQQADYIDGLRYKPKNGIFFIENEYLIYKGDFPPKAVKLKILLENPLDYIDYIDCNKELEVFCSKITELEFPIDSDLIDSVVELTKQEILDQFYKTKEDIKNDTQESKTQGNS